MRRRAGGGAGRETRGLNYSGSLLDAAEILRAGSPPPSPLALSLSLSLSLSVSLSLCLPVCLPVCLSVSVSVSVPFSLLVSLIFEVTSIRGRGRNGIPRCAQFVTEMPPMGVIRNTAVFTAADTPPTKMHMSI